MEVPEYRAWSAFHIAAASLLGPLALCRLFPKRASGGERSYAWDGWQDGVGFACAPTNLRWIAGREAKSNVAVHAVPFYKGQQAVRSRDALNFCPDYV